MTDSVVRVPRRALVGPAVRILIALAALSGLTARDASAQQPEPPGPVVVGRVVDSGSGTPLPYAIVNGESGRPLVVTDSAGVFRMSGLPPGVHNLTASQLGYSRLTLPVAVAEGMEPVEFKLFPDPIAIEGIKVMGDRFRGRRNALPIAAQAYDQIKLQRSPAMTVMDFLQVDARLTPALCPGRGGQVYCFNRRNQVVQPQVFLDEAPLVGGLSQLEGYNPRDFYLVEVIGQGLMVRVYTHGFMEQMSRNPRALEPIILK